MLHLIRNQTTNNIINLNNVEEIHPSGSDNIILIMVSGKTHTVPKIVLNGIDTDPSITVHNFTFPKRP